MLNAISYNIQSDWLKSVSEEKKRSVWVENKQGKIELINRQDYRRFKYSSCRFQRILHIMTKELHTLSQTVQQKEIQTLFALNQAVDQRYKNYRAAHKTPLFGWLYLFVFAHSIQKEYQAFKTAIYSNLKKQFLNLSHDEFEKAILILPLSEIDMDSLTPYQSVRVLNAKIENFDSLNEKDKSILINLSYTSQMTDDQFDRLFKKASFKALNPSLLTLTKKNIVIKNALNRLQTLLKIDLLDLRTFIPFMTNDQLSQFGDKLGMISIKSCLTSEQVGFCLETGKILVRDLNDVELNRAAKFLSNSNLNELNVSVRDQLRLNNFTPAQILNNWSLWNRHQRRSIDLSDWSVEQVLMLSLRDFEGVDFRRIQLSTWDLLNAKLFVSNLIRPFQPFTLTCFDWSEELFEALFPILSKPVYAPSSYDLDISECYFARWNSLNVVRLFSLIKPSKMKELSNAFIERNISFIPKIYLLSLNPDLKKLNYANLSDDCIRKLFHNVRPDLLRDLPLNIIKQHLTKIPNLNFLSSRTLERMDFNDFPFEILLELTSFSSICYKLYEIRLYRFTQDQITSLFDIFGVERFNVSRYVNFISLADYPRFTLEQCRSIQFDKLSFEQKMAFKQSQLKVMYGYSSYKNQNSSESYSHEIPKDNSYSVTSKQVEWQTTIQKVRAYFASGALSPVTNDAPTQFFTLRNLIINSNNLTPKEVLEVLMPNFSDPDKAFKKGSPFIHPDRIQRNGGSTKLIEEANELFKVLNEARSILAETKNRTNF